MHSAHDQAAASEGDHESLVERSLSGDSEHSAGLEQDPQVQASADAYFLLPKPADVGAEPAAGDGHDGTEEPSQPSRADTSNVDPSKPSRASTSQIDPSKPSRADTPNINASRLSRANTPKVPSSKPSRVNTPKINVIQASEDHGQDGIDNIEARDFEAATAPEKAKRTDEDQSIAASKAPSDREAGGPAAKGGNIPSTAGPNPLSEAQLNVASAGIPSRRSISGLDFLSAPGQRTNSFVSSIPTLSGRAPLRRRFRSKVLRKPVLAGLLGRSLAAQVSPAVKLLSQGATPADLGFGESVPVRNGSWNGLSNGLAA